MGKEREREREREHEKEDGHCHLDLNIYATRKTVAQGMMDIALLTANASQLKHILSVGESHDYYTLNIILIGTSMALQVLVGILLVFVGRWNLNKSKDHRPANTTNNMIVLLIFLITVVNVLITSFDDDFDKETPDWVSTNRGRDLLKTADESYEGSLRMSGNYSDM